MKLIIVDDNTDFRNTLKTFLEFELNHTIIATAANGEEFLKLRNIANADIILMDIKMEGIDGFEATKVALMALFNLKVIALSSDLRNIFLQKLIETGFKGFIDKNNVFYIIEHTLQQVKCGKYIFPNELIANSLKHHK